MTDEGFYPHGIMHMVYYSGECKGLKGCRAEVNSRKALMHFVLADERDLIDFEDSKARCLAYGNY